MEDKNKDPYEERRKKAMEKAMQKSIDHEKSFIKSENTDTLQKRMGSDLFKGGLQ